jgi:branched-chain amino acid transport system ATP-binding protein
MNAMSLQQEHEVTVASGSPFFSANNITKQFGALTALDDLSFDLIEGEIFGIAGPNGAGKSTLLNVCSGVLPPSSGEITFEGQRVDGLPPYSMCHKGLGRTFQIPQVFSSMSVQENIAIGLTFGNAQSGDPDQAVEKLLEISGLGNQRFDMAGKVDLITRKMTMLMAVLATRPKIIFMDEPLAGLNADEMELFTSLVSNLHMNMGVTFVMVEHKIRALSKLSDRMMIIHFGGRLCLDTPEVVVKDEQVIEVYLGTEFDA